MFELVEEYKIWLHTLGFSKSIVYNYTLSIKAFFEWLQQRNINQINLLNQSHITNYFEYLQTRKNKRNPNKTLSIAHLNKTFDAVDKFLQFLQQIGLSSVLVATNYRIKDEDKIYKKPLTQEQIKALQLNIEACFEDTLYFVRQTKVEEMKLIFALYYGCGLRRSEGFNLCIKDVNFDNKTIFIRQGKNYKDRIIPMNTNIFKALEHYIYNYRNLIKINHQKLFTRTDFMLNDDLKYLCKKTFEPNNRPKITLHILRHSIATHLLQNGMSIENISKFLGHSSLESTQIYTHIVAQF